jgi:NACHT domain/NACHT N-terminal Helical domain 1
VSDPVSTALLATLSATLFALHEWVVDKSADRVMQRRAGKLGYPGRVLDATAEDLVELRRVEFADLADGEWAAAQDAVAESLRAARLDRLVRSDPVILTDPERLRGRVRTAGGAAVASAALSDGGLAAYRRMLEQTCRRIAARASEIDGVLRAVQVGTASRVDQVLDRVELIAGQPELRERREQDSFERRYLSYVAAEHATFELFQVSPGRAPARHRFADYYSVPSIARRQRADSEVELTGAGIDGAHAISSARRVLLLGGAGAGKTTFLHWLAHTVAVAARDGDEDVWRAAVPFFVPLRQFADRDLPEPEDLVRVTATALSGAKPRRWVSDLLDSGRGMLLVDGIDEVLLDRRDKVRRWLAGLVRAYPRACYVVSTRPAAVPEPWLAPSGPDADDGLDRYELLPLGVRGLQDLIGHWFTAARAAESEPEQRAWLERCEQRLVVALSVRPDVRSLVSSPLLCSVLCALYRNENMYLPQNRKDLLTRALKLLLGEWDVRRGVAVEDELAMSHEEKVILLERFAAPMVRNSELLVRRDDAVKRFERAMSGLRSQGVEPVLVLRHMLERTGLLRQSTVDDRVQFVHRTFRDFLAAGEFVKAGELGYLIDHAHDDGLNEVIFMAAAQARAKEAAELIGRLLERAGKRGTDRAVADRLTLLAAASLGYVAVIDPEHVRTDVITATRRLIPPKTFEAAELLARAGSFVIDLLPGPIEVGKHADETGRDRAEIAACVIRTLALIGGEEPWEKIQAFGDTDRGAVIDELLRAWRQNEYSDEYALALLSNVDFGDRVFEVHRWDVLLRLHHLRTLAAIRLVGDLPLDDASVGRYPLAELPTLRHLEIKSNETLHSLDGLAGCNQLRSLWISGYSALEDLSALAGLAVADLRLLLTFTYRGSSAPALDTLTGARLRRLSIRHPDLTGGLHALPADLPLVELDLAMRPDERNLLGIGRWATLETLTARGIPSVEEMRELASLPNLRRLELDRIEPVGDVVRLQPLGRLRIELSGVSRADEPALRDALPDADLVIHATEDAPPAGTR